MGTRLLRGRNFESSDTKDAPKVMIVSASMAKALWPAKEAAGSVAHCWSRNDYGQIGNGTTNNSNIPEKVVGQPQGYR
ncbi:MAG: hypothetical protein H0W30_20360 [Gemmatimonadaceae bacterium]|nr:hypothetical protein [Gemmatimonadaceae bacterium]MDQ3520594.1 hypothetical protein [Gemmatimonadota bacterium]